jgi:hypothetical protein
LGVPTVSSYAWEHYKTNWVQLDAPRHFYLYSVESIGILAAKVGLVPFNTVFNSTSLQFWGSEQYKNNIPLLDKNSYKIDKRHSIFSKKDISTFDRRSHELNKNKKGDSALFYLKKSAN